MKRLKWLLLVIVILFIGSLFVANYGNKKRNEVIDDYTLGVVISSARSYASKLENEILLQKAIETTPKTIILPTTGIKEYPVGSGELEKISVKGLNPISNMGKVILDSEGILQSGTCLVFDYSNEQYNVIYDGTEFKLTENNRPCNEE